MVIASLLQLTLNTVHAASTPSPPIIAAWVVDGECLHLSIGVILVPLGDVAVLPTLIYEWLGCIYWPRLLRLQPRSGVARFLSFGHGICMSFQYGIDRQRRTYMRIWPHGSLPRRLIARANRRWQQEEACKHPLLAGEYSMLCPLRGERNTALPLEAATQVALGGPYVMEYLALPEPQGLKSQHRNV
jgi:hypothetical protein